MTPEEIESAFVAGRDAPENATCPHHPATLAAHWWTRGFVNTARLNRALTKPLETPLETLESLKDFIFYLGEQRKLEHEAMQLALQGLQEENERLQLRVEHQSHIIEERGGWVNSLTAERDNGRLALQGLAMATLIAFLVCFSTTQPLADLPRPLVLWFHSMNPLKLLQFENR